MVLPLKVLILGAFGYVALVILAWRFQERMAFPAPRGPVPDPRDRNLPDGQRVAVATADGVRLYGWYLPPSPAPLNGERAPGLLWFYGNAETVGDLAPIVRELRPPGMALLILDYRGYGESEGRTTERGLYLDAEAAWAFLAARPEVDSARIAVYGRSLGGAPALYVATERPVRAVVLESPFTNARDMAREHYRIIPPFVLRLSMDNLARSRRVGAPLLVLHGAADRVVPFAMGKAIAEAARGELLPIDGADHNETYVLGGAAYRTAVHRFLGQHLR